MSLRLVIAGTDTDVGKTVVSALVTLGLGARYWKPVQCGLDAETGEGDRERVGRLAELAPERLLPEAYRLQAPVSPHLAAEREGLRIEDQRLELPPGGGPLVVETAGGLLVPLRRDRLQIDAFRAEHGDVVMKPLYGNGGAAVFKVSREDPNFGSLFDLFSVTFREPWVVQRFLPQVTEGDKRIILVDGEAAGAVNRVPAANDIRSNMVRGGAARPTDLTKREHEICETIGPDLKRMGLIFVGIDVIDGNLTEINVTSPTGLRAIKRLGGPDIAATIWDAIEAKL